MKIKKYILTETGEVRSPKIGEYYLGLNGYPDIADYDYMSYFPILKLEIVEIVEEEWEELKTAKNNCFPTKELAEEKLAKIKQVLRGKI